MSDIDLGTISASIQLDLSQLSPACTQASSLVQNMAASVEQNITQKLGSAQRSSESFLTSMLRYRVISEVFSGVERAVGGVVKGIVELDHQASRVSRVLDRPFDSIKWDISSEVSRTGASIKDVAEAYYQLGTRIKDTTALQQAVTTAMNVSVGTEADVRDTTRSMLQIYAQFGDQLDKTAGQGENMRRIGELLAVTWKASAAETNELTNALRYLGPEAEAAKIPLEQVTGLLTALTMEGQRGRMAGTEAAQFISNLIKHYNDAIGGIAGKGQLKGLVAHFDLGKTAEGGIDLYKTLENIVRMANSLPTEQARQFLMIIGGTQNAFRFLGTQGQESLQIIRDQIEKAKQALSGQTHEAEKLKGKMMDVGQEWQRTWTGAISAIGASLNASPVKGWLHDVADELERITNDFKDVTDAAAQTNAALNSTDKRLSDTMQRSILKTMLDQAQTTDQENQKQNEGIPANSWLQEKLTVGELRGSQQYQMLDDAARNFFLSQVGNFAVGNDYGRYQSQQIPLDQVQIDLKKFAVFVKSLDEAIQMDRITTTTKHPGKAWSQHLGKFIDQASARYDVATGSMMPEPPAGAGLPHRPALEHTGAEGGGSAGLDAEDLARLTFKHKTDLSRLNPALLADAAQVATELGMKLFISAAKDDHSRFVKGTHTPSRHGEGNALDIAAFNGISFKSNPALFKELGDQFMHALIARGYAFGEKGTGHDAAFLWQTSLGGNHFNHLHMSRQSRSEAEQRGIDMQSQAAEKAKDERERAAAERAQKVKEAAIAAQEDTIDVFEKSIEGLTERFKAGTLSAQAFLMGMETIAPALTQAHVKLDSLKGDNDTQRRPNMGLKGPGGEKLAEARSLVADQAQAAADAHEESVKEAAQAAADAQTALADLLEEQAVEIAGLQRGPFAREKAEIERQRRASALMPLLQVMGSLTGGMPLNPKAVEALNNVHAIANQQQTDVDNREKLDRLDKQYALSAMGTHMYLDSLTALQKTLSATNPLFDEIASKIHQVNEEIDQLDVQDRLDAFQTRVGDLKEQLAMVSEALSHPKDFSRAENADQRRQEADLRSQIEAQLAAIVAYWQERVRAAGDNIPKLKEAERGLTEAMRAEEKQRTEDAKAALAERLTAYKQWQHGLRSGIQAALSPIQEEMARDLDTGRFHNFFKDILEGWKKLGADMLSQAIFKKVASLLDDVLSPLGPKKPKTTTDSGQAAQDLGMPGDLERADGAYVAAGASLLGAALGGPKSGFAGNAPLPPFTPPIAPGGLLSLIPGLGGVGKFLGPVSGLLGGLFGGKHGGGDLLGALTGMGGGNGAQTQQQAGQMLMAAAQALLQAAQALSMGLLGGQGGGGLFGGLFGGGGGPLSFLSGLPFFADGGAIDGPAIVGEKGPELLLPRRPGFILPASFLANLKMGRISLSMPGIGNLGGMSLGGHAPAFAGAGGGSGSLRDLYLTVHQHGDNHYHNDMDARRVGEKIAHTAFNLVRTTKVGKGRN